MEQKLCLQIKQAVFDYKKLLVSAVKWSVFIVSAFYLVQIFTRLEANQNFLSGFLSAITKNLFWLTGVLLLLPFNWLAEAYKWQKITCIKQELTLNQSLRAILAGSSTAFFSPNRTGEFVGRALYFDKENRPLLIPFALLNSFSQNLILIAFGFPLAILFFMIARNNEVVNSASIGLTGVVLIFFLMLAWVLWRFLIKKSTFGWLQKIKQTLLSYKKREVLNILMISFFRYLIFSAQFYLMLRFFEVDLSLWQALLAVPTNYLFVTLTPAFAFSEAGVRGSMAVLIIGAFSDQITGIALAGMTIWLVNFVIPMAVGSLIIFFNKNTNKAISTVNKI